MPSLDARGVAGLLREYAQRTALRGGNPYPSKAYSRAADSLAALAVPLDVLVAEDRLTEIPGVGDAIADIVTKLHKTGSHPSLEKLRKEIPAGVLEMLAVPGLRPEKVLRLYQGLGIASLDVRHPGYGFADHKGYPVPAHYEALARLGACAAHRRSFGPVRKALGLPPLPPWPSASERDAG